MTEIGYVEGGELVDADLIENEREFRLKYPSMLIITAKELCYDEEVEYRQDAQCSHREV